MRTVVLFLFARAVHGTQCDLADTDSYCAACVARPRCAAMFGLNAAPHSCGASTLFDSSLTVLKSKCPAATFTNFTGTADCEVLGMIAEGLMDECGPKCGRYEFAKVNTAENHLYCACDGKCIDGFQDNTLNALVGTLIGLLVIKLIANVMIMIDSVYNLGLIGKKNSVTPIVGKTV